MFVDHKSKIDEIYKNYAEIENDIKCILDTLKLYEAHYEDNDEIELANRISVINKLLTMEHRELKDNNHELDVFIMKN